jgi:hypothetical protein
MTMNRRTLLLGAGALALSFTIAAGHARPDGDEIVVIVNKSNGVGPMNRSQLSTLFKARSSEFPGGGRATAVNLPPENSTRQDFDLSVLGMRPDEVERFWLDSKIRSGVGSPRKLTGAAAMVRFVGSDETAIGYVPASDARDAGGSLRIVARIRQGQVIAP